VGIRIRLLRPPPADVFPAGAMTSFAIDRELGPADLGVVVLPGESSLAQVAVGTAEDLVDGEVVLPPVVARARVEAARLVERQRQPALPAHAPEHREALREPVLGVGEIDLLLTSGAQHQLHLVPLAPPGVLDPHHEVPAVAAGRDRAVAEPERLFREASEYTLLVRGRHGTRMRRAGPPLIRLLVALGAGRAAGQVVHRQRRRKARG